MPMVKLMLMTANIIQRYQSSKKCRYLVRNSDYHGIFFVNVSSTTLFTTLMMFSVCNDVFMHSICILLMYAE